MSTNSTNNRATHYGTCQICGSLQKANRKTNRLADHGYTLAYGFQSGTCTGSGELPFEVCKAYAEEVLALYKRQVAEFVETPRPESTAKNRWEKCPKITAWKLAQYEQAACKNYIFWAEPRLANWAPSAQKTVREVEAVEVSAKASRTGIRALSGAVKLAKRDLSKFGEHFQTVLETTINGNLYDERQAFWRVAIAAKNYDSHGRLPVWPRESEIVDVPRFASNSVAKLARIARNSGNAELIVGAEKLEKLSEAYETARKAYAAAKA